MILVSEDRAGQRLDNFLLSQLKGVPRSWVYRVIRKGEVRVNSKRTKPLYQIKAGDQIRVPPVRTAVVAAKSKISESLSVQLEKAILYEDNAMIVINKPSGLAVHGGSGVSLGLIESVRQMRPDCPSLELVHRLDRDTSGCVMLAKKRSALKKLQDDIRQKVIRKNYLCLVAGQWPDDCHKVSAPLQKFALASGERLVKVNEEGKQSLTLYQVRQRYDQYTLVQASPVTGRTHQIRVHCQYMRCPIIGDSKYCPDDLNLQARKDGFDRLFLHAISLELDHPVSGEPMMVEAPLDSRLAEPLEHLN